MASKKVETHLNFNPILSLHTQICTQIFPSVASPFSYVQFNSILFLLALFFYLEYGSFFKHTFDTQETTIKLFFRVLLFFSLSRYTGCGSLFAFAVHVFVQCLCETINQYTCTLRPMMPYTRTRTIHTTNAHSHMRSIFGTKNEPKSGESKWKSERVLAREWFWPLQSWRKTATIKYTIRYSHHTLLHIHVLYRIFGLTDSSSSHKTMRDTE